MLLLYHYMNSLNLHGYFAVPIRSFHNKQENERLLHETKYLKTTKRTARKLLTIFQLFLCLSFRAS